VSFTPYLLYPRGWSVVPIEWEAGSTREPYCSWWRTEVFCCRDSNPALPAYIQSLCTRLLLYIRVLRLNTALHTVVFVIFGDNSVTAPTCFCDITERLVYQQCLAPDTFPVTSASFVQKLCFSVYCVLTFTALSGCTLLNAS
jgi:hypothetical protein